MVALEASMILATLVGLLCNWKQERGALAQDHFQDFITWLEQHHFNDLRAKIIDSVELQKELQALLQSDIKQVDEKLDIIGDAIAAVAARLPQISALVGTLEAKSNRLSSQAVELLQKFAGNTSASYLCVRYADASSDFHVVLEPSNQMFKLSEPKFMESDLRSLELYNYIERSTTQQNAYSLTRAGEEFAKNSQAVTGFLSRHQISMEKFRNMITAG